MKRLLGQMIVTVCILSGVAAAGEWTWRNPYPQGNDLYDIHCFGNDTCIAVGQLGTILRTVDAGSTWSFIDGNTRQNLTAMHFADRNTGYIVSGGSGYSGNGLVLKTTDGGVAWDSLNTGQNVLLRGVYFISPDTGYVCGQHGTVIRTLDGGQNWNVLDMGTTGELYDVRFANKDTGFVSGAGYVYRTLDGGASWEGKYVGGSEFDAVYFRDARYGMVTGRNGYLYATADAGSTWSYSKPTSSWMYDIDFWSADTGYMTGQGDYKTVNGGQTWSYKNRGDAAYAYGMCVTGPLSVYIVGQGGMIKKTDDGGDTWQLLSRGWCYGAYDSPEINVIHRDGDTLLALGGFQNYLGEAQNLALKSGDGTTWLPMSGSGYRGTWYHDACFLDDTLGFAAAQSYDDGMVVMTADGGRTWDYTYLGDQCRIYGIDFFGKTVGLAVGGSGTILRTGSGGDRWTEIKTGTVSTLWDVACVGADTAFAVGDNAALYRSTDGGITWDSLATGFSGTFTCVTFLNGTTGFIGGYPNLLRTDDGGVTWDSVLIAGTVGYWMRDISFLDDSIGYAAGLYGTLAKTLDGGLTWELEWTDAGFGFNNIQCPDANTVYVTGENSGILEYADTLALPAAPTGLILTEVSPGVIRLDWQDNAAAETGYQVYRNGCLVAGSGADEETHTDSLAEQGDYAYRVRAFNASGVSAWSGAAYYLYDVTAPRDSLFSLQTGAVLESGDMVSLLWKAEDNIGTARTELYFRPAPDSAWQPAGTLANGNADIDTFSWTVPHYRTDEAMLRIVTRDAAGNIGGDSSAVFTIITYWNPVHSGTGQHLRDVSFPSLRYGFAVGDSGYILHTADAGSTWQKQNSGTAAQLNAVFFPDTLTGFAAGYENTVIRTTDGGRTWEDIAPANWSNWEAVCFTDALTGFVAGQNGRILKTVNGGRTWTEFILSPGYWLKDIRMVNHELGFAVGQSGTICRTQDGGQTWVRQAVGGTSEWRQVFFVDADTGYVTGAWRYSYKTVDGGDTWAYLGNSSAVSFCYGMDYLENDAGYYAGTKGYIGMTPDGNTFAGQSSGTGADLRGIDMVSSILGCVVGDSGTIVMYRNNVAAPAGPVMAAATGTGPEVSLAWQDNADDETGFVLYRANEPIAVLGPDMTAFTDTVPAEGSYGYKVRAVNAVGVSAFSQTMTFVFDTTAAAVPWGLVAADTAWRVDLAWHPGNDPDQVDFLVFRDTVDNDTGARLIDSVAVADTQYVDTAVQNAVEYYYWVAARDRAGNISDYTFSAYARPNSAPVITSAAAETAMVDSFYQYIITVEDSLDPYVSVSIEAYPYWLEYSGDTLYGTPGADDEDTVIVIVADDGYLTDTLTVQVTVMQGIGVKDRQPAVVCPGLLMISPSDGTGLSFMLEKDAEFTLVLYNCEGIAVRTWEPRGFSTGFNQLTWQERLSAGVYLAVFAGNGIKVTRRVMVK